ncbi:MAG: DEAD/DEAH box helicase [Actinobacteria bacterium]|nr:DEAD/DEAH box helicase [Actinomycetota bacterium]
MTALDTPAASGARSTTLQLTFVPSDIVPAGGVFALWGTDDVAGAATALELPAGDPGLLRTVRAGDPVTAADVSARTVPLLPVLRRLAAMPTGADWPAWRRPADSILAWSTAAKLALETVVGGHLLPGFRPAATPAQGVALWRAVPPADGRLTTLAEAFPVAGHALRLADDDAAIWDPHALLAAFMDAVADVCARQGRRPDLDPRRRGPRRPWAEMWGAALTSSDPTVAHLRLPSEEVAEQVDEWAGPLLGRDTRATARLAIRLEPPVVGDGGSDQLPARLAATEEGWTLQLLLQSVLEREETVPAAEVWERPVGTLELAGRRVDDAQELLVRGLSEAARLYPPLDRALSEARPTSVGLDAGEVATLLGEGSEALTAAGFGVLVPPELREAETKRLRARIRIGGTPVDGRVTGATSFDLSSLTDFRYEIALGDETLSRDEFAEIVALKQPLVRWRGQWVRVDHEQVDRLAALDGTTGTVSITEALAAALSGQHEVDDLGWVETVAAGDIAALLERLRTSDRPDEAEIVGIDGTLRDYQKRGVAWLQALTGLGMGGVLADDMGLGKTLMAIALLTSRPDDRPSLVVCPTSVVGNWEREIRRFAPDLPVIRHHGPERPNHRGAFPKGHVAITSYALMRRDIDLLEDIDWDVVVFDEAQQIKNRASKGAKAARALPARARIAMTGTPIENRLSELWAIVDVTNPGLLGSQRAFSERFAAPIERWRDEEAASRLRRLVAPFVMRRLKSDPDVAVDLPPKNEITVHCSLTREQASLYQAAVDGAFSGGLGTTTFERRGRILALLTALKQICNHPAQYLRDDGRLVGRSGKLTRATEILAEIVASGDRGIVFTQYREMGELLKRHLAEQLELPDVPFLHGGVTLPDRDAMVERFQEDDTAPPIILVSLRAGGTGLNLTRATEVMHFDRWWNPAVEAQATDRAHRIGQTRAVNVHTLVTAGTVEDRIAELLERKKALADSVVGAGEAWITELDDDDLRSLVALSEDDVEDEDEVA